MAANITEKKPGLTQRVMRSIRDMRGEMKRVVWPTKKQTVKNTIIVIVFMIIMAIIIGGFDSGLSLLIQKIFVA